MFSNLFTYFFKIFPFPYYYKYYKFLYCKFILSYFTYIMDIVKIPACWPSTFVFGISVAGKYIFVLYKNKKIIMLNKRCYKKKIKSKENTNK